MKLAARFPIFTAFRGGKEARDSCRIREIACRTARPPLETINIVLSYTFAVRYSWLDQRYNFRGGE